MRHQGLNGKLILSLLPLALLLCAVPAADGQTRLRRRTAEVSVSNEGAIRIAPKAGQRVTVSGAHVPYSTKTALTPGATVVVNSTLGNFFTLTPAQNAQINATVVGAQGQILILKVLTSGTTSYTITFGTNFTSTGTLATGTVTAKVFMVAFLSDGSTYSELFRTAAQ